MNNRVIGTKNRGLVTLFASLLYNSNNFNIIYFFLIYLLDNETKEVVY